MYTSLFYTLCVIFLVCNAEDYVFYNESSLNFENSSVSIRLSKADPVSTVSFA